jgi:uncharacterized phage protein gp47/JayE
VPFARPTLPALVDRVKSDIRGRLGIAGPLVRRTMADILAAVWAGAVHMLHGHLEWAARQLFPDTSEREFLLRQASLYGITPTPATFATGTAIATGTNGSVIPAGTILQLDVGITYRVTAGATIASGMATLALEAVLAGAAANVVAGAALSFESPIAGVDSTVTVTSGGITRGFEEEDTDGMRDRLILRLREPPQGGAEQDYKAWALAVAGVTRVWVFPNENGLGTVVVRFVLDGQPNIFPGPTVVASVQAALDAQRPITAEVTAAAPTPFDVNFDIEVTPNIPAVHAAVRAELADLLFRDAEPGDAAGRGTIRLSRILVAIGVADGLEDFVLNNPTADVVPGTGALPILGDVEFT